MVKEGYKQTEIGEIPEDWEPFTVGDLVAFSGGSQPDKSTFINRSRRGYIRLIQIRDYKTDKFETYIPEQLANKKCDAKDVMIGRYGPPIFQILRGIEGAYNVALIKATPDERLYREFFYHFIKNEDLFLLMDALSRRSSGQTGVELPALKRYPLALPTKREQKLIADALSDVDDLILSLEKLIAKKRDIKTATMQQLLAGKKRLPGFDEGKGYKQTELGEIPDDWDEVLLGEFSTKVGSGITPTGGSNVYKESGRPFVRSQNIGWGSLKLADLAFIDEATHSTFSTSEIQQGDVLLNITGASIGRCSIASKRLKGGNVNQHVCIIRMNNEISHEFLCYVLLSSIGQKQIESFQAGGNREGLNFGQIRSFLFPKPKTLSEQIEIAKVLSDLDGDINVWEGRLKKTKAIKQGMMQELLTGRTRLVDVGGVEQKQQKHGT